MNARATLSTLVLVLCACAPPGTGPEGRDLRLLEHMLRLNALHVGIQPHLRDVERFAEMSGAVAEMERLAEDPVFVGWPSQRGFRHPPEPFERYRQDLLRGARAARAALEAGDKEALHAAYAVMNSSCIACHKRFSPTY